MRHTLRETWSGLRRNVSMTIAVIITMWVSLTLLGAGLMATQQIDLVKAKWYDKIEVSVFLCVKDSTGDRCTPGQDATDAQRQAVKAALEASPQVQGVVYKDKAEAYAEFRKTYAGTPILETLTEDQMQDSYRVKLRDPEHYKEVVQKVRNMPGVQNVQDLHSLLDSIFSWLNAVKWATVALSSLLLGAGALQIANTIRLAAQSRRRELGIMRLVGASNSYIMLPFLLESLVAGVLGAALACASLGLGYWLVIRKNAALAVRGMDWIGWQQTGLSMVCVAVLGILLSVLPTLVATRKYLRI